MAVGNLSKRVLDKGLLGRQSYRFIGQHRVDIIFTEAQIGKYLRGMFADQGRPGAANILARDGRCTRYLRDGDGADAWMLEIIDSFHGLGLPVIKEVSIGLYWRIHDPGCRQLVRPVGGRPLRKLRTKNGEQRCFIPNSQLATLIGRIGR